MKEDNVTIYQGSKIFYGLSDDGKNYQEIECYENALLDESEFECTEIVEVDYSKENSILLEDYEEGENIYSYNGSEPLDKFKIPCTLYKILLPNNEIMSILQPNCDDLEWECDNVFGLPIRHWVFEKSGKREATDEEIDCIE